LPSPLTSCADAQAISVGVYGNPGTVYGITPERCTTTAGIRTKTRKGSKWLRTALIESARRAARLDGTYMRERYLHVCRRRGDKKAVVAVAHEILIAAYRVLSTAEPYDDPGPEPLRRLSEEHVKRRALAQLRSLGYEVTVQPSAA
jgi:transposase